MNVSVATSMTTVLAESRAQREKQVQERAEAKLHAARSAMETLKKSASAAADDAKAQRKAAAKQKVEQLKARIRMLQMSGSADPKLLAQLARELKAAVKMYGGDAGGGVGPAPVQGEATSNPAGSDASAEVAVNEDAPSTETATETTPATEVRTNGSLTRPGRKTKSRARAPRRTPIPIAAWPRRPRRGSRNRRVAAQPNRRTATF
jgi:hypothetical protein